MLTILLAALVLGLALLCGGATVLFSVAMGDEAKRLAEPQEPEAEPRAALWAFWGGLALTACALSGLIVLLVGLLFGLLTGPWQ